MCFDTVIPLSFQIWRGTTSCNNILYIPFAMLSEWQVKAVDLIYCIVQRYSKWTIICMYTFNCNLILWFRLKASMVSWWMRNVCVQAEPCWSGVVMSKFQEHRSSHYQGIIHVLLWNELYIRGYRMFFFFWQKVSDPISVATQWQLIAMACSCRLYMNVDGVLLFQ